MFTMLPEPRIPDIPLYAILLKLLPARMNMQPNLAVILWNVCGDFWTNSEGYFGSILICDSE
jgi:hypothetical protein